MDVRVRRPPLRHARRARKPVVRRAPRDPLGAQRSRRRAAVTGANSRARTCTQEYAAAAKLNRKNHLRAHRKDPDWEAAVPAREFAPVTCGGRNGLKTLKTAMRGSCRKLAWTWVRRSIGLACMLFGLGSPATPASNVRGRRRGTDPTRHLDRLRRP